jgi:hypothetical protein
MQLLYRDHLEEGPTMSASVRLARTAGLYYLLVAVFAGFAQAVRLSVCVSGDAGADHEGSRSAPRPGAVRFVADLTKATFAVFWVLALFRLLEHVNRSMAPPDHTAPPADVGPRADRPLVTT